MTQRSILERYPEYEVVIGMEVHVQLTTATKIFCPCANSAVADPNSNICQICTGYPGVLPKLNRAVVDAAIKVGLATNCTINERSEFDRKHYFYPDLPKSFQITQQFNPICTEGYIPIILDDGTTKKVRLHHIHIEEDAGKNIHAQGSDISFVDLNRAGTPLLEIVSYPDISSSYEVRAYLKSLRAIVQYLGVCTGNMEQGAFRADTNISIRKKGETKLGTKCELKNINSFKFISDATDYEIERQILLLEDGGKVIQETRLWDTKDRKTIVMRTKEGTADYRFFNEPDLPVVMVDQAWISRTKAQMPELPDAKCARLCAAGLSPYEAGILIEDQPLCNFYEEALKLTKSKHLINWVLRDLMGYLKEQKIQLADAPISPIMLAELVDLLDQGVINNQAAAHVFATMAHSGKMPRIIVKDEGLEQIQSTDELERIITEIIAANPEQVAGYKSGKDKLFSFFVGQAMAKTKGKGNPQLIQQLLKKHLM